MFGAVGIGLAVTLTADSYRSVVGALAVAAVVLLAVGVAWPLPSVLPWPLVVLGGIYAWTLGDGAVDEWAPVYAGAFLAVAELAYWSVELRGRAQDAERLTERRIALITTIALIGVGASGLVLAATSLPIGSGIGTDALGVVAAVVTLAAVAALARPAR